MMAIAMLGIASGPAAQQPQGQATAGGAQDHVAALKQTIQQGMALARKYEQDDVVTLAVQMSSLPDGAIYAGQTTLEAKAKNITVVVQNSGYRPVQQ
jgi:hypothetical protein